jgi:hypothetical protein
MKDTGKPRAKGASAPGRKPPPDSAKFTSTNQPSGEAKKNGRLKNKTGIELARAILQLSFEGAKDSPLKKAAAEYFKISEQEITVEMMLMFRQAEKAVQKGDTRAFEAVMDRAFGKPKQDLHATVKADVNLSDLSINFE